MKRSAIAIVAVTLTAQVIAARGAQVPASPSGCPGEPALVHPCALEKARTFRPPRTRDGRPNLQGFWRGQPSATENIEEHPKTEDDDGGKSLIVEPAFMKRIEDSGFVRGLYKR